MFGTSNSKRRVLQGLLFGLPLVGVLATAFMPLSPVVRQGMIGVILIWFQVGLLSGLVG